MLIVTQKGSILASGGRVLTPGTKVSRGIFTDPQVKEHLKSGFLAETREGDPVPGDPTPASDPVVKQDNVGDGFNPSTTSKADIEAASKAAGKTVVEKPVGEPLVSEGKWNSDPATLEGKDLDTLNLMVLDIDSTVEPFETIEEATAFLSQDWKAPKE